MKPFTEQEILAVSRVKRPMCQYQKPWGWRCHHYAATAYKGLPYCRTHARILSKPIVEKPKLSLEELRFAKAMTKLIKAGFGKETMIVLKAKK